MMNNEKKGPTGKRLNPAESKYVKVCAGKIFGFIAEATLLTGWKPVPPWGRRSS
jgi:hypothetical protein